MGCCARWHSNAEEEVALDELLQSRFLPASSLNLSRRRCRIAPAFNGKHRSRCRAAGIEYFVDRR